MQDGNSVDAFQIAFDVEETATQSFTTEVRDIVHSHGQGKDSSLSTPEEKQNVGRVF